MESKSIRKGGSRRRKRRRGRRGRRRGVKRGEIKQKKKVNVNACLLYRNKQGIGE
jgi:hypothetical protein